MKTIATYNLHDDQIYLKPDERLSESDYQEAKSNRFRWWPGSKQFVACWSPGAEDFALRLAGEIETVANLDKLEERVARFESYADKSEQSAESSQQYLENHANTERRQKNAINAIERESSKAEHYHNRVANAIRHAEYKERPDVIHRRIKKLEAQRRKSEREYTRDDRQKTHEYEGKTQVYLKSRRWVSEDEIAGLESHYKRWVEHLDLVLEYQRGLIGATGVTIEEPKRRKPRQPKGVAKNRKNQTPQVLGAFGFCRGFKSAQTPEECEEWRLITKVNRLSCESLCKQEYSNTEGERYFRYFVRKVDIRCDMDWIKSPEEVRRDHPELLEEWEAIEERKQRRKEAQTA